MQHTTVLTVNRGSATVKCALYAAGNPPTRLCSGQVDRIGQPDSVLTISRSGTQKESQPVVADRVPAALELIDRMLEREKGDSPHLCKAPFGPFRQMGTVPFFPPLAAIGHRVVHGGAEYQRSQRVTAKLLDDLRRISPFAPEHLPVQIELIEAIERRWPDIPQAACFDTAFHADLPAVARLLPIPRVFERKGLRRYGFHGLSYSYLIEELARLADPAAACGRVILAHLGNGSSMAAVRNGKSIDTSMAFTPAAGFPMSTRSGDIDPGLIWYLGAVEGLTHDQLYDMVNRRSGLLGVSETTSDMRELLARCPDDPRAAEAVDLFCYSIKKWIGAFTAALGGLDTLVFSGGIGENAPAVRSQVCQDLGCLGIALDEARNAANAAIISADASRVIVRVIRTDEEQMIARETFMAIG